MVALVTLKTRASLLSPKINRKSPLLTLLFLAASIVIIALGITKHTASSIPDFQIVETAAYNIYDGDTFQARVHGTDEYIRLIGVDTPEMDTVFADEFQAASEAKDFTRSLIEDQRVWLVIEEGAERDRYSRILAYVWLSAPPKNFEDMRTLIVGNTLNGKLLTNGHALPKSIEPNTTFAYEFESVL